MNGYNRKWRKLGINKYQRSFRVSKSTAYQIQSLKLKKKTLEYAVTKFHLLVDFKAAYCTISREKLLDAMKEFKIPHKLIAF
jgi:hypothetical protein